MTDEQRAMVTKLAREIPKLLQHEREDVFKVLFAGFCSHCFETEPCYCAPRFDE